jgi:hypothetical protein
MAEEHPDTVVQFGARFPDDAACLDYLTWLRWGDAGCHLCAANGRGWLRGDGVRARRGRLARVGHAARDVGRRDRAGTQGGGGRARQLSHVIAGQPVWVIDVFADLGFADVTPAGRDRVGMRCSR